MWPGDRVVADPLCKPFSMGRNLFCVHSRKHMDDEPAPQKEAKQRTNRKTLTEMTRAHGPGMPASLLDQLASLWHDASDALASIAEGGQLLHVAAASQQRLRLLAHRRQGTQAEARRAGQGRRCIACARLRTTGSGALHAAWLATAGTRYMCGAKHDPRLCRGASSSGLRPAGAGTGPRRMGRWTPDPFDPSAVELMRQLGGKARPARKSQRLRRCCPACTDRARSGAWLQAARHRQLSSAAAAPLGAAAAILPLACCLTG